LLFKLGGVRGLLGFRVGVAVIEVAVGYVGEYLVRKAKGLLDRATGDADQAFDRKLGDLYCWVVGKLTGHARGQRVLRMLERSPDVVDEQDQLAEELTLVVDADPSAAPPRPIPECMPTATGAAGWWNTATSTCRR
jgi:hypothetical protein